MWKFWILLNIFINLAYASTRVCSGKHLLPLNDQNFEISIRKSKGFHGKGLGHSPKFATFENNGQTVLIKYFYGKIKTRVFGGPYGKDEYEHELMYFNWLSPKYSDPVNDALPIELHIVFSNNKYETYENALQKNFGVTVWSFKYIKSNSTDRTISDDLYDSLEDVLKPNTKTKKNHPRIQLSPIYSLIYLGEDFFVYQGRLLPSLQYCSRDVIWVEFPTPLKIKAKQLEIFHKLLATDGEKMMSKYPEYLAPNGSVFRNVWFYNSEGIQSDAPPFEPFNATNDYEDEPNSAVVSYGKCVILLIMFGGIFLKLI